MHEESISLSVEMYLVTIHRLTTSAARASTQDIARLLDISLPSVTGQLKRLSERGYVDYAWREGASLTDAGRAIAVSVLRKNRLIKTFLYRKANYAIHELLEEACFMERCAAAWGVAARILYRTAAGIKLIIYRPEAVDRQLARVPLCILHGRLRYPLEIGAALFLDTIADRWSQTGSIPDEIGFALGYEIENVLGFMGIVSLPCRGFCGWKVFSDLGTAESRRCAFQEARRRAQRFIAAASTAA